MHLRLPSAFAAFAFLLLLTNLAPAEELAGKRYVIIHADDAGMSHSVNMATIDAMKNGVVSSASIMVPCPWFPEFAKHAKEHPEKDFGIHLTLNCEWKVYKWGSVAPPEKVPSLLNENGYLWRSVPEVAANAKAEEVAIELRAQIDRALKYGVPLTHLDTHMGALVSRPDLLEVYVKLGLDYNLPVLYFRHIDEKTVKAYPALADRGKLLGGLLEEKQLPLLDELAQFYSGGTHQQRKATYLKELRNLKPGVSQIIIHCGYDNRELQAITNSSANRDGDRRIFSDPQMAEEIERMGIEVITWKQFHEMAKKKALANR